MAEGPADVPHSVAGFPQCHVAVLSPVAGVIWSGAESVHCSIEPQVNAGAPAPKGLRIEAQGWRALARLAWVAVPSRIQPQRGCGCVTRVATRSGLGEMIDSRTQGSRGTATLGFVPLPRWGRT